ncbi:hypothetical protein D3C84_966070 [compost metagenome]
MRQKSSIDRKTGVARIVVNFHTRQHQPLRLPVAEHQLDLRRDLVLVQRLELTIQTNHRNQRPTVSFQKPGIDPRPTPAGLRKSLQGQHP